MNLKKQDIKNHNISVDEEVFWKLNEIKVKKRFKKVSDVIEMLIKLYKEEK